MSLYLALDVGGTKTAALLAEEGRILACASAGSLKTLRVSPSEAANNLQTIVAHLEAAAGLSLRGVVARTCIGTSGVSAPRVRSWIEAAVGETIGGDLLLLGDEVIALDAAFVGGRGVLAIAGTGSNVVGRASTGEMVHAGGWGPALADEGSGHWIGTEALRACFRAIDAAPPSSADAVSAEGKGTAVDTTHLPLLLRRMMAALRLQTLDEIIGAANASGFHSAALVPIVTEAAREGDQLAVQVLSSAGADAAGLVANVIRKLSLLEATTQGQGTPAAFPPPPVAYVGGVLANIAEVRGAMHAALAKMFPGIVLQEKAVDPLAGALWHARGCPGLRERE